MSGLFELPMGEILNGMERLQKGLGDSAEGIWCRLRLDEDFRKRVVGAMLEEDQRPTHIYSVEIDHALSRWEMLAPLLQYRGISLLRKDIIEGLLPREEPTSGREVVEMQLIYPCRRLTPGEARQELKRRGLRSVKPKEAIAFFLEAQQLTGSPTYPLRRGFVVPDATYCRSSLGRMEHSYLSAGVTLGGYRQLSLWSSAEFSAQHGFLCRTLEPDAK